MASSACREPVATIDSWVPAGVLRCCIARIRADAYLGTSKSPSHCNNENRNYCSVTHAGCTGDQVAERAVAVDDGGPNPYLPTPVHLLLQLPDERVQLARELLRRNSAAQDTLNSDDVLQSLERPSNHTDAYAPEQFADGLLYSTELRKMFEDVSQGGGTVNTLTMGQLALAVHSWRLPF